MKSIHFLVYVLLVVMAQAQDRIRIHGTTIGGKVLSIDEGQILFRTRTGETIRLSPEDFRLILKQIGAPPNLSREDARQLDSQPITKYSQTKRVFGQIELGMVIRNSPETTVKPAISGSVLFRPVFDIYAGVGSGFEKFDDVRLIPVFARVNAHFSHQAVSPYLEVNAGYGFAKMVEEPDFDTGLDPSAEGGIRFHPKFGFKIVDKIATTFTLGILYQKLTKETGFIDWRGNPVINREKLKLNMMTFGLGLTL